MSDSPSDILVIHDGGLPALVAAVSALERASANQRVHAWCPPEGSALVPKDAPAWSSRVSFVQQQATLLGLGEVIEAAALPQMEDTTKASAAWPQDRNMDVAQELLRASARAARLNCSKVIWPVVCGGDLDAVFTASEQAQLITRLIELDQEPKGVAIETPLADLSWRQLTTLASELDVPLTETW
ncbi:MAG: hypothetical protein AAGB34_07830, partial [Planctomycetota bacterium]